MIAAAMIKINGHVGSSAPCDPSVPLQSAMMTDLSILADPRVFPDARAAALNDAKLHALAAESLAAGSRQRADALDSEIRGLLAARIRGNEAAIGPLFTSAPTVAVTRHLWRQLDAAWQETAAPHEGLAFVVFALPIVIVSGIANAPAEVMHPGILDDANGLAAILEEHGALGGSRTIALSNALVATDAIDLPRVAELFAWQTLPASGIQVSPHALTPSPLIVPQGREGVHLRFVVGSLLGQPGADPFADPEVGAWGVPFAKALSRELAVGGASVLALPRAPQRPLPAVRSGLVAQREVGAQIFASNAIRKLRASVGEPSAVISAHRVPGVPGGGELRLSLSSPFAPRDAEGFQCPLYPMDRVGDVAAMLGELLADCRVTDVRVAAGVHPDRDPATGVTLLFKPDTLPGRAPIH